MDLKNSNFNDCLCSLKIIAREEGRSHITYNAHGSCNILHLWNSIYQSDHSTLCSFFIAGLTNCLINTCLIKSTSHKNGLVSGLSLVIISRLIKFNYFSDSYGRSHNQHRTSRTLTKHRKQTERNFSIGFTVEF